LSSATTAGLLQFLARIFAIICVELPGAGKILDARNIGSRRFRSRRGCRVLRCSSRQRARRRLGICFCGKAEGSQEESCDAACTENFCVGSNHRLPLFRNSQQGAGKFPAKEPYVGSIQSGWLTIAPPERFAES